MIEQVHSASKPTIARIHIHHKGEPLNNYENVLEACRGMIDNRRWNLAHGRVTVSTVGVSSYSYHIDDAI